jgi:processive 1,2-diacylglycerol beta-glucosyltransferase
MPATIAIFSVSAGTGHVRAAEALIAAAAEKFPHISVVHLDLMSLVPPLFKTLYADSYLPLVERHPALWGYLYTQADKRKLDSGMDKLRVSLERLNLQKFKDAVDAIKPSAVICTHFLPAEIFSRWKRKRKFPRPVWVAITDFDVHMLWVHRFMSGYCTASEEVAFRLRDRGIDAANIHVTGIPIMPVFAGEYSRGECARQLGVDPLKPTFLLMSGGAGMGGMIKVARRLLSINEDFQLLALAGRNVRLLSDLQRIALEHPNRMFPMGYTSTIERVMAASDLAITKSGGLTTSECLAMGLPMVVVSPIPGQEERNADFLLEQGAALKAYDESGLEFRIRALLRNPDKMKVLRENARRLGRANSAEAVLRLVLQGENMERQQ